jgi:glycosyltransferase involved in cell wall biosynthesis
VSRDLPTIDVIVPCYNYAKYLPECVGSILAQTGVELRVLIADDASPDDTEAVSRELMRADSRVHYRRNPVNLRNIENYNTAFEWVTADLTAILSADDLMMAGALLRVATLMAAHPEVVMTYGRALYFTGPLDTAELLSGAIAARSWPYNPAEGYADGQPAELSAAELQHILPTHPMISGMREFFLQNRFANQVHMSSAIVRTDVQRRVGGYSKALPHAGDFEMWLRLATQGPIGFIDRFQIAGRMHESNMSTSYYADRTEDFRQRALALDAIEAGWSTNLPPGLLAEMRHSLAISILRRGTDEEMVRLARAQDPRITESAAWRLLALKQRLRLGAILPRPLKQAAMKVLHLA